MFAARLAAAGHDVTAIGRPDQVGAIHAHGLVVEGLHAGVFRVQAREQIASTDAPEGVWMAVKTFDLADACRTVALALDPTPPVLLTQNGLRIEDRARASIEDAARPTPPLVRALATIPATYLAPGRVRAAGDGELLMARHPAEGVRDATRWFADLLRGSGLAVREVEDLRREEWRKALVNAAINPVTADHGVTNGKLADDPWRGQALQLLHEARRAAALDGIEFAEAEVEQDLFRVVRATAENRSSMLQDIERGRPTEIDAISGVVVEVARAHGVDLPATRRAIDRIQGRVGAAARRGAPQPS